MGEHTDQSLARRSRMVSLVIAGTLITWMLIQLIGKQIGLPGRYALLFDFAAIAALIWALVNVFQIWRARQSTEG
ncbi:DUF5337 domain-containing protein [Cognatishimia sp. SS12]|uniref:DUF5337 domain-containing protein n=1 Tax=Cognatishimia sp. SS12 TaxID=2979465 RepID=UPI00232B727A|nr:DUF5337 domain-containing protein [Cognatishimia sp. SS12]MDC0736993.1 DUF5337 domain-containing protein [Cognatishimia sp. SS12]